MPITSISDVKNSDDLKELAAYEEQKFRERQRGPEHQYGYAIPARDRERKEQELREAYARGEVLRQQKAEEEAQREEYERKHGITAERKRQAEEWQAKYDAELARQMDGLKNGYYDDVKKRWLEDDEKLELAKYRTDQALNSPPLTENVLKQILTRLDTIERRLDRSGVGVMGRMKDVKAKAAQ